MLRDDIVAVDMHIRAVLGTEYPVLTAERRISDFQQHGFDEAATRLIMRENAARLLGLDGCTGAAPSGS